MKTSATPKTTPRDMVEGVLEICLSFPRMSGYAGPEWPKFCVIYVDVGGQLLGSKLLPFEYDVDDIKNWKMFVEVPVASNWLDLSLDIFVERCDWQHWRNHLVVTRGGPHTSDLTDVIGRARVPLLDALVIGDLDDDDEESEEGRKKRRRDEEERRNLRTKAGTMVFGKAVPLLDWELGDAPRSVVRGAVDVWMNLRRFP